MALTDKEVEKQLTEVGNKLLSPSSSVTELLSLLDRVESLLSRVEQSPSESMKNALSSSMKALVANELLKHPDIDVKVAVASCISEITRITAPDAPYEDEQMKEVFQLIVSTFEKLDDKCSKSYLRRTSILETVAKVRSCVVMLDLECDALILEMFQHLFRTIRTEHPATVLTSMETIMTLVLDESEEISKDLLSSILNVLKIENKEVLPIARQLGEEVIKKCDNKLKPLLVPTMKSLGTSIDDYTKVVSDVLQSGSEVNDTQNADAASKNAVGLETMNDAPPSEDVGVTTVGSPKSAVSNGTFQKEVEEDASAGNNKSKEDNHEMQVEEPAPAKTKAENSVAEKVTKSRTKVDKVNKRKGKKSNSSKSSSEPPIVDEKKGVEMPEIQEEAEKDVENEQKEGNVTDTAEPVGIKNELEAPVSSPKTSEAPVSSPKTSDEPVNVPPPSPSRSRTDEICSEKVPPEKKKDELVDNVPKDDEALKRQDDLKKSSEGVGVSEAKSKRTEKKVPSAADNEDSIPSSVDISKKEDEKTSDLDAKAAKQLGKKAEAGTHREDKMKRGHDKVTLAKDLTNTPSKDEEKKSVVSEKSAAKSSKGEGDVEKASKSSSKRKRSGQKKGPKYGEEMVGARVMIWWPDDKKFYEGVIEHFDNSSGKHKVAYVDGDIEILKLEREKWKQILEDPVPEEDKSTDGETADETAETPKAKKAKTSPVLAKKGKTETSAKTAGASTSKSKAPPKSQSKQKDSNKTDSKSKDKTVKSIGKSVENKGGKSNDSKSSNKASEITPKSSAKTKDTDETSKGGSKSKQETPKVASKSKGKSPKTDSKPSGSSKVKAVSSAKEEETEDRESSPEPAKKPENPKVKSPSKSQKNSNKRKRGTKG
ncbi:unnamed protein product [Amaranthus hypochondriacus]